MSVSQKDTLILLLVGKFVVLGAEARQADTIAVTSLGYDVEHIKLWFLILSHSRNFF